MNWRWEEMTSGDFSSAVNKTKGVCLFPLGILEKHGEHLPLGEDMIAVHDLAVRAAEQEPAVVFPFFPWGQVQEMKNLPGAIALPHHMIFSLLEHMFEEIARNGMHKIILLNGHGGNETLLPSLAFRQFEKPRDYTLYIVRLGDYYSLDHCPEWKKQMQSEFDYHAGEMETSIMLSIRPELVHMERVPKKAAKPKQRMKGFPSLLTSTWWYADWPDAYAGDARHATAEKGKFITDKFVEKITTIIKAVKEDEKVPRLAREFSSQIQHGKPMRKTSKRSHSKVL